jgi:hypothetical protein
MGIQYGLGGTNDHSLLLPQILWKIKTKRAQRGNETVGGHLACAACAEAAKRSPHGSTTTRRPSLNASCTHVRGVALSIMNFTISKWQMTNAAYNGRVLCPLTGGVERGRSNRGPNSKVQTKRATSDIKPTTIQVPQQSTWEPNRLRLSGGPSPVFL